MCFTKMRGIGNDAKPATVLAAMLCLLLPGPTYAFEEIPSHVVVATVKDRFAKDITLGPLRETYTKFVVQLWVEELLTGQGIEAGQTIYAHCSQLTRHSPITSPAKGMGHKRIPKPGQRIQAELQQRADGSFDFLWPYGFSEVGIDATPEDYSRERPVSAQLSDHWWSFTLGAMCAFAFLTWWEIRARRPQRGTGRPVEQVA